MNPRTYASILGPGLKKLIWLGVASAWIAIGLYVYKFVYSTGDWFVLSPSKQEWGTFGDYLGGILNPFFSYRAFLGVLFTVILQARQLDAMKAQAGLEEMQRVQSTIAARVDALLASPFVMQSSPFSEPRSSESIFGMVSALGTHLLREPATGGENWERWLWTDESVRDHKEALRTQTVALRLELDGLAWMLLRYQEQGGDETVLEFYGYRYRAVTVWLDALGLLDVHHQVQKFFKPGESRKYMQK